MTTSNDRGRSFLEDLPFTYRPVKNGISARLEVSDELTEPEDNQVRISVLASVADVITGVLLSSMTETIALTVDLSARIVAPIGPGLLEADSRVVKQGRTLSSTEVVFHHGGRLVAHSWVTFMPAPQPVPRPVESSLERLEPGKGMRRPFIEELGILEAEEHVFEVERSPYTLQPVGTLQGGVICALAEFAAEKRIGAPISEISVHYLSTIRIGPGRASAEPLGSDRALVTVVDAGRDDHRIGAVGFASSGYSPI